MGRGRLAVAGGRRSAGGEKEETKGGTGRDGEKRDPHQVKAAKCEISPEHRVPLSPGPPRPAETGGEGNYGQLGTKLISIINY